MKKILIVNIALTLFATFASAQETVVATANRTDFRERFMFGLKAGTNFSKIYDSQNTSAVSDGKFGFAGGLFIAIPIGELFGIQPEVMFSQKGFKATADILGNNFNFTRTTNYIDLPIFFAFKPSEFLKLLAGPQYSYTMQQNTKITSGTTTLAEEQIILNNSIRKNILGFSTGFEFTMKHVVMGARVAWDLQTNNADGSASSPRYKNMLYQFTAGYRFYQQ